MSTGLIKHNLAVAIDIVSNSRRIDREHLLSFLKNAQHFVCELPEIKTTDEELSIHFSKLPSSAVLSTRTRLRMFDDMIDELPENDTGE